MTDILKGHCLCQRVRYEVPFPFMGKVAHCHCSMCRRAAGSIAVTWFTVEKTAFKSVGDPMTVFKSSDHGERGFCGHCGTPITFWSAHYRDTVDVTLASLEHPGNIQPDLHIWTATRLPWLKLDTHLPDREGDADDIEPTH